MISIVICSRSKIILENVAQDVLLSIGVPCEIIEIDNAKGEYSIFQAYNRGVKLSRFGIICFMHEDISFKTKDWGKKVISLFDKHAKLGLLGVAGSSYKPAMPSGWSYPDADRNGASTYMNIIQSFKNGKPDVHAYVNPKNENLSNVASIDGVWFCARRTVFEKIKFDEEVFNGFHCYDIDFSLAVSQHYDVAVTFEILLRHFSEGSFDSDWLKDTIKLHNKWSSYLPVNIANLSDRDKQNQESGAFYYALPKLINKRELILDFLLFIWRSNIFSLIGIKRFSAMNLSLIRRYLTANGK